jgi:hypothetical protein
MSVTLGERGLEMYATEELVRARQHEVLRAAEQAARARRLVAARRWQRRAEAASRRARLASAAVR